ncbi:MAG: hypothetical protein M0Z58_10150, partial [Nitrospiraceae bacterium]|nr:hypothetical protein [Nitrospiraceae bacterium]
MAAQGAYAATYYVSPGGSDSAPGTTSAPWATFAHAMTVLHPGDTLYLEDGTYDQSLKDTTVSGSASGGYITFKALHDGAADVVTTYPTSPLLLNQSYIDIEGINFQNSGPYDSNPYCATDGEGYSNVQGLNIYGDNHVILRRVVANGSSGCNSAVIALAGVSDSLIEDCAASGEGRVVLNLNGCNNDTIRRCWLDWTGPDTGGGDVDNVTQVYDSSNILMENNIGVNFTTSNIEFFNTWGHYSSISGNKFYGNIGINTNSEVAGGMFMDAAECGQSVSGTIFSDNVGILLGGGGQPAEEVNAYYGNGTVFTNNTFVSPDSTGGGGIDLLYRPSCEGQQAAVASASSNSFLNLWAGLAGSDGSNYLLSHDYNNFYNMYGGYGPLAFASKMSPPDLNTHEIQADPGYPTSTYGYGAYLMAPSSMQGKGSGGTDIGANVIYEYVNGSLTSTPLWPWPMESRIVAAFGKSATYADDGNGHTGGIWKTLSGIPTRSGGSDASGLTAPVPISPVNGQTTGTTVTLQWQEPAGGSGLSYTLLLSKNSQFTGSQSIAVASASGKGKTYAGLAGFFLFGIAFSGVPRKKKLLLLLAGVFAVSMLLASCGGGGSAGVASTGSAGATVSGSYTVTGLSG